MRDNAKAVVLVSFGADSLALGVHWLYDAELIASEYGRKAETPRLLDQTG